MSKKRLIATSSISLDIKVAEHVAEGWDVCEGTRKVSLRYNTDSYVPKRVYTVVVIK